MPQIYAGKELTHPPQGVVIEDDTALVLGADIGVRDPGATLAALTAQALAAPDQPIGSVVARGTAPQRLHAVVHDLDCDPSWDEAGVRTALETVLEHACRDRLRDLALPLLGTVHGRLESRIAVRLTIEAWRRVHPPVTTLRLDTDDATAIALLRAGLQSG